MRSLLNNNKAAYLLAFLTASLLTCTPVTEVQMPQDAPWNAQIAISSAASDWNKYACTPLVVSANGHWIMHWEQPPQGTEYAGYTEAPSHDVWIRPDENTVWIHSITLHEFGHVMGLKHIGGKTVMNQYVGSNVITADDLLECYERAACCKD